MNNEPQLYSSIIALVSLASGIAAKHPDMGLCQLDKLRSMGVPESQINSVIEIARIYVMKLVRSWMHPLTKNLISPHHQKLQNPL